MFKIILNLWLLLGACCLVKSEGYYSVIAPGTLRSNSPYDVAVGAYNTDTPVKFKLEIAGQNSPYQESKIVTVNPGSSKIVTFDVPEIRFAGYHLYVEGIEGLRFKNDTLLNFDDRSIAIFVQTDKSVYKPGDLVRFRVLFLNYDGRPLNNVKSTKVMIKDPSNIIVRPFKVETLSTGVYENEFQLSAVAPLGQWEIFVHGGHTKTKTFKVEEYIPPKFEVTIDIPDEVVWPKVYFSVIVRAKYTFGKYVKGEAKISVVNEIRTVPLNGKAVARFDNIFIGQWTYDSIPVIAEVTDTSSGLKQTAKGKVVVHSHKYVIGKVKIPRFFSVDEPFSLEFKVTNNKGVPVLDTHDPVQLVLSSLGGGEIFHIDEQYLDKRGIVTFDVDLRNKNCSQLHQVMFATVSFKYAKDFNVNIETKKQKTNTDKFNVIVLTENPIMQEDVSVQVLSAVPINYFSYQVVSKGKILLLKEVEVPNKDEFIFKFTPTVEMFPSATVFAYYVSKNGDLVFDETSLDFNGQLKNFLKVKLQSEAKPGEDVNITVITEPNSFVGLLGVDQSVLLQEDEHDFKLESFKDEFAKVKCSSHLPEPIRIMPTVQNSNDYLEGYRGAIKGEPRQSYQFEHLYTRDISKPYPGEKSGLTTLTNANFPYWRISLHPRPMPYPPQHFKGYERIGFHASFPKISGASMNGGGIRMVASMPGAYVPGSPTFHETQTFDAPIPPLIPSAPITVRREFPETWLWESFSNVSGGQATVSKKVPDTITSWVVTGFSISPEYGVGLTKSPKKMTVFQRFFISMNLPYSVKNGEVISVPVIVFNYMSEDIQTEVSMLNDNENFVFVINEQENYPDTEIIMSQQVTVAADSTVVVNFMIRPKKIGDIVLKAKAVTTFAGDLIEKVLLVKPEGLPQYYNKGVLLTADTPEVNLDVTLHHENVVPDSLLVEFSVGRDALASVITNLHKLVRMPHGCGEQNMVNFVPNYLVLDYLNMKLSISQPITEKALNYLRIGYQTELKYLHPDGSFSAFGLSDKGGSTWLTAYVARCFTHASKFIDIDERVIDKAFEFLKIAQFTNGSFPEKGVVVDRKFATVADGNVVLTAFTLIAFLENRDARERYRDNIELGLDYLQSQSQKENDLDDPFALAIVTYVFQLARHNDHKDVLLDRLLKCAKKESGQMWWTNPLGRTENYNYDEEATAYALLALLSSSKADQSSPIVRWLVSRQQSTGGFSTTQSTVVALLAFIKYTEKFPSNGIFNVNFKDDQGTEQVVALDDDTPGYFRTFQLSSNTKTVTVKGSGQGSAIAQLSYRYHVKPEAISPLNADALFSIVPKFSEGSTAEAFTLTVCTNVNPKTGLSETSMAVMEVDVPSGYSINKESFNKDPSIAQQYKKVETKNEESVAVFYFDKLDANQVCVQLEANRIHTVEKQKLTSIVVYDYYNNVRRGAVFYLPPKSTSCDLPTCSKE